MKKLLFVLSFITLYTYSQEKTNNSKIIIEEIKSCLQFTEKKKVKKENSRKYEYQKGFNAEGWQCIENVISQHINNFNFQTDWLSEIYLSKKIDTNKLISLRDQLKNETKKKKRNYDYLGVIADKLDQNITNIDLGKVEWEKIHGFRRKAPKAGIAPEVQIGDYQEFKLKNGLQVILVENHKKPVVSFYLVPDFIPFLEKEKTGTKDILSMMMGTGTKTKSKAEIDEITDYIGATINFNGLDGIFASSLKKHQTTLLELINDIIINPVFSKNEFNKSKKQMLSGLESQKSNSQQISNNISNLLNYGKNHPYGELINETTINNIELKDVKNLYTKYFKPNISYLVIVGDIELEEAKNITDKYFKKWKKKKILSEEIIDCTAPEKNQVAFVHKEGAVQSTIKVTYPIVLKPGSKDEITCQVMNSILGGGVFSGRLMQNLREDKAYTYGARSRISSDKYIGEFSAYADVRNEVTDSAVVEFIHELNKMKKELVTEKELNVIKNYMTGSFSRALESPFRIAQLALNIKMNDLDKNYYKNYLKALNDVSAKDIYIVAQKYIKPDNCNIIVVGNKDISNNLQTFDNKITFFDYQGEMINMEKKVIDDKVTVESIIENNIKALGGKENMNQWSDVILKSEMEIQGAPMKINLTQGYKKPNNFFMSMKAKMLGELQGMKYNGSEASMSGMQGERVLSSADIEKEIENFLLYPILSRDELGNKFELKEIEVINGVDTYKVIRTNKQGDKKSMFFSTKSGHLVKEVFQKDGMQNIIEYSNYTSFKNLTLPKNTSISVITEQGSQIIKAILNEVIINEGIDDSNFN
tara:strand:- start:103 stop:2547 length:2445 start_codon:yes stop_codon:yes gene_type:complete